jgi:hypothetical protein
MACEVYEIGGIFAVVDREGRVQADLLGVSSLKPGADPMERAGPNERIGHDTSFLAEDFARNALHAFRHLASGAARERHQQDAPGIGTIDDQMGNAVGERIRLARPRTGDDQERPARRDAVPRNTMLDSAPLLWV